MEHPLLLSGLFSNWNIYLGRITFVFILQEGDFDLLRTLKNIQALTVPEKEHLIRRWNNMKESTVSISFLWPWRKKVIKLKPPLCCTHSHVDSWVWRIYTVGKQSLSAALYFISANVQFIWEFSYQSLSTKRENGFYQISTKVTFDRVQKPGLLQDGDADTF